MNRQQKIDFLRSLNLTVADDISDGDLDALFAQHENSAPPAKIPVPPVQGKNPAPPPAATLATEGEVTDERALALERRAAEVEERERKARELETGISERERKIQEREESLRNVPTVKPAKVKRPRNWSDPVNAPEEIEAD